MTLATFLMLGSGQQKKIIAPVSSPQIILTKIDYTKWNDAFLFLDIQGFSIINDGELIVGDKLDYSIRKINFRTGNTYSVGKRGRNNGEFMRGPGAIDFHGQTVAVADFTSGRIQLFKSSLAFKKLFRVPGAIASLAFDKGGALWVSGFTGEKDRELFVYDSTGTFRRTIPLRNTNGGMYDDVCLVCTTPFNEVVVTYFTRNIIEVWDTNGNFKRQFSVPEIIPRSVYKPISTGSSFSESVPDGEIFGNITSDEAGRIYLIGGHYSPEPGRTVYVMETSGKFLTQFTLPTPSRIIRIRNNILYAVEGKGTIITQYKMQFIGFKNK
jgi:hypothetical protein